MKTTSISMYIEAMKELEEELSNAHLSGSPKFHPTVPSVSEILDEIGPLPREALFMGLAGDGFPVLLNLHNPEPGPLLIAGDSGSGKTDLLRGIAKACEYMHPPTDVQYGVITPHPDEWDDILDSHNGSCVGMFPTYHDSAADFVHSCSGWAHSDRGRNQSVLILVDGLQQINAMDFDVCQSLRWLLLKGAPRKVWVIATMNSSDYVDLSHWVEAFRTRIFGRISDPQIAQSLSNSDSAVDFVGNLYSGFQFVMREGDEWLEFIMGTTG